MCPRCSSPRSKGLIIQDRPFELNSGPSFHCVNCGLYVDRVILKNKADQQKGHIPDERNKKSSQSHMGDVSYSVFGSGNVLLGDCGVLGLI